MAAAASHTKMPIGIGVGKNAKRMQELADKMTNDIRTFWPVMEQAIAADLQNKVKVGFAPRQAQLTKKNSPIGDVLMGDVILEMKSLEGGENKFINWANISEKQFFNNKQPFTDYILKNRKVYWNHMLPQEKWSQLLGSAFGDYMQLMTPNNQVLLALMINKGFKHQRILKQHEKYVVVATRNNKPPVLTFTVTSTRDMLNELIQQVAGRNNNDSIQLSYKMNKIENGIGFVDATGHKLAILTLSQFLRTEDFKQQLKGKSKSDVNKIGFTVDPSTIHFTFSVYIAQKIFNSAALNIPGLK